MEERAVQNRLLVVNLKSDAQQVAQIVDILDRLDIPAELLAAPPACHEPAAVVLRIPPERMVEAVLALSYHGFGDVRACEADRP